ncbi:hypothetical protein [Virgibacillus proomii]
MVPVFLVGFAMIPYFPITAEDAITFIETILPSELTIIL